MRELLLKIKKEHNFFMIKMIGKSFTIILNEESYNISFVPFGLFSHDFKNFLVNESSTSKTLLFIRKTILDDVKLNLFLETTFKHSLYFCLNYNEKNFYKYYFPVERHYTEKDVLTVPNFHLIKDILKEQKFDFIINMNSDIKDIMKNVKYDTEFLNFCKDNLSEHKYDEVRLLWEIL